MLIKKAALLDIVAFSTIDSFPSFLILLGMTLLYHSANFTFASFWYKAFLPARFLILMLSLFSPSGYILDKLK